MDRDSNVQKGVSGGGPEDPKSPAIVKSAAAKRKPKLTNAVSAPAPKRRKAGVTKSHNILKKEDNYEVINVSQFEDFLDLINHKIYSHIKVQSPTRLSEVVYDTKADSTKPVCCGSDWSLYA